MAITANGLYSERAREMLGMASSAVVATNSPTAIISRGLEGQAEVLSKVASYTREQVVLLKQQIKLLGDIKRSQSSWGITDALITKLFTGLGGRIFGGLGRVGAVVGGSIAGAAGAASGLFRGITTGVVTGISKLTGFISGGLGTTLSTVTKFFGNMFSSIPRIVSDIGRPIQKVFSSITSLNFGSLLEFGGGIFKSLSKVLGVIGRIGGKFLLPLTALLGAFDAVKGFMNADSILGRNGVGIVGKIGSALSSAVNGLLLGIPDWISDKLGFKNFAQMMDSGGLKISEYTEKMVTAVSGIFGTIADSVVGFVTSVTDAIGNAWEAAKTYISSIGTYIKDSVASAFGFGPSPTAPTFNKPSTPAPVLPGTTTTGPTLNMGGGLSIGGSSGPTNMLPSVPAAPSVEPPPPTPGPSSAVVVPIPMMARVADNAVIKTNAVAMSAIDAQRAASEAVTKTAEDSTKAVKKIADADTAAAVTQSKVLAEMTHAAGSLKDLAVQSGRYIEGIARDFGRAAPHALAVAAGTATNGLGGFTGNGGGAYSFGPAAGGSVSSSVGFSGGSGVAGGGSAGVQNPSGRPASALDSVTLPGMDGTAPVPSNQASGGGSAALAAARSKAFAEVEADPALKEMVLAMPTHESTHYEGPLEALFNRSAATGQSVRQLLYGGFYGPIVRHEVQPLTDQKKRAAALAAYERVRGGSNDISLRTDQGMRNEHTYADKNPSTGGLMEKNGEWYSFMGKSHYDWAESMAKKMAGEAQGSGAGTPDSSKWDKMFSGEAGTPAVGSGSTLGSHVFQPFVGTSIKTRNKPIDKDVLTALDYAGKKNGVFVEVTSGGQDAIGEGHRRTGTTRHDRGASADVRLYTVGEDGKKRYVDMSTPEGKAVFAAVTRDSAAMGMTGFGAGQSYMGNETIHIGKGPVGTWGAEAKWLASAYKDGASNPMDPKAWAATQNGEVKTESVPENPSAFRPYDSFGIPRPFGVPDDAFAKAMAPSIAEQFRSMSGLGTVPGTIEDREPLEELGRAIGEGTVDVLDDSPRQPSFTPVAPDLLSTGQPPVSGSATVQNPSGDSTSSTPTPPSTRDVPSIDELSMLLANSTMT